MAFAEDYFDARSRFVAAAARAGLDVETHWHPTALCADGRRLAVDVVFAGRVNASHALFTVCGTHGVEGYPGSAAQIQLMESGRLQSLPSHVAVVILHGLNPHGWSRSSQRNEGGIDVNRNFIDFAAPPNADQDLVDRMAEILEIGDMSYVSMTDANGQLLSLRNDVGTQRFMQAIAAGQYVNPRGFKYGGSEPSWSNQVYHNVISRFLDNVEYLVELDWHTGLGDYGDVFPLCFAEVGSDAYALTCDWWGRREVERGVLSWSTEGSDAPAPGYRGMASDGLRRALPNAQVAGGVVEFGTVPVTQLAMVVFLDHWLTFNAGDRNDVDYWRAQMRVFMAPREPRWERSVLRHADRLTNCSLDGLINWGKATNEQKQQTPSTLLHF